MNARRDRREAPLAWGVAGSIHIALAWWALRPAHEPVRVDVPMQVVYVTLAPPVRVASGPRPSRDPVGAHPTARSVQRIRKVTTADAPASATVADPARAGSVAAQAAPTRLVLQPRAEAPPAFQRDLLADRRGSIQPLAPERFRMREPRSIGGVVRGVAQSLFWPPGYSDDPCSGLPEAVEKFKGARTERERELLADAVRERNRYCRH